MWLKNAKVNVCAELVKAVITSGRQLKDNLNN